MTTPPVASRSAVLRIGVFTAIAAAVTFAVLVYAGRELGPSGYAQFMVVWGIFFATSGCWQGLQQEVTRSLSSSGLDHLHRGLSLVAASAAFGVVGGTVFVCLGVTLGSSALGLDAKTSVILGAGLLAYALVNGFHGALSASGEWRIYGGVILLESVLRATFLVVAITLTTEPAASSAALVGGALAWVVLTVIRPARRALRARLATDFKALGLRVTQAVAAAGCSVMVIAGFPVLLDMTTSETLDADAGVLLAAVVVTRAPVLLLVSALQGVFITRLVAAGSGRGAVLSAWLGYVAIALVPILVGGYLAGPSVLTVILGDEYEATGSIVVGLAIGAAAVLVLTLTGWTTLAGGRHSAYVLGWVIALMATVLLLLLPFGIEARSIAALIGGPVLGAVAHVLVLRRAGLVESQ